METSMINRLRIIAIAVFLLTSIFLALAFFQKDQNNPFQVFRYSGVAVIFFASLVGTFEYAIKQATGAKSFHNGLSVLFLGMSTLLCLLSLKYNTHLLTYNITVNLALFLYIVWDYISLEYYKNKSPYWYNKYRSLLSVDYVSFGFYAIVAWIPFWSPVIVPDNGGSNNYNVLSDILSAAALWLQVLLFINPVHIRKIDKLIFTPMNVEQGYNEVAEYYDNENAIIHIERRYTINRLKKFNITGNVLDLGCGTGYYSLYLSAVADSVFAIDISESMLNQLNKKISKVVNNNIIVYNRRVSCIPEIADDSISFVICCLVVDHIKNSELGPMFKEIARVMKPGARLYITDVNPYFEIFEEKYAKYNDDSGSQKRIAVFPHSIFDIITETKANRLSLENMNEICVEKEDIVNWEELDSKIGYPLLFEYTFIKV